MTVNPYDSPKAVDAIVHPGQLPVRSKGTLTADDAYSALRMATRRCSRLVYKILIVMFVLVFGFVALMATHFPIYRFELRMMVVELPMLVVVLAPAYFLYRRNFARSWNARPENHQPVTWTFSEEGLLIETANSKQLQFWTSFSHALVSSEKLILVQQGGMQFNFVPRKFFETEEDWVAVSQLLAKKFPVKTSAKC